MTLIDALATLEQAQQENERLKKELRAARGSETLALAYMRHAEQGESLADDYADKMKARAEAAESQVARLREALKEIADIGSYNAFAKSVGIAKRALAATGTGAH